MKELGYRIPFVLMAILGLFFIFQYYIPHPAVQVPKDYIQQWKQPLNAFIVFVALGGLVSLHIRKVIKRQRRWGYSMIMLVSTFAMVFVGLTFGIQDGSVFADWFKYVITPIEATMYSLLAFFVASAAFRAFRARTTGATILLVSGIIVMLGLIPVVEESAPFITRISSFILEYPNTAAKRAILIGVALGAISVSLKTILGLDRTILGKAR